ncbi:MAG TPA: mechanosensitive ion channel, partial [Gammaproteobacteria bacterium]|nr:mechanosensitive ion channel [Gammaproteobacteria bacterium]
MNQDQIQALFDQLASYALDAVGALVILLVGWWIAGRAQYLVRRGLDRVPRIDDTLKPFLSSSVRYFVIVITFVAVLAEFGVQTTSIIAVLGAAGL